MEVILAGVILGLIACGLAGSYVAAEKGRPAAEGLIMGLLFGPIGLVVEALMPTRGPGTPRRSAGDRPAEDEEERPEVATFLRAIGEDDDDPTARYLREIGR